MKNCVVNIPVRPVGTNLEVGGGGGGGGGCSNCDVLKWAGGPFP